MKFHYYAKPGVAAKVSGGGGTISPLFSLSLLSPSTQNQTLFLFTTQKQKQFINHSTTSSKNPINQLNNVSALRRLWRNSTGDSSNTRKTMEPPHAPLHGLANNLHRLHVLPRLTKTHWNSEKRVMSGTQRNEPGLESIQR